MALKPDAGVRVLLPILASAAAVVAGLLFLASFLMSGAFAGRVPGGSNAAGLVVPLFASIGAGVLLLVATWLVAAQGRLAWIGAHAGLVATLVMAGVGAAAVGVLIAWMERMGAWVTPLGVFCGGLAPALALVLLWRSAWSAPGQLQDARWPRVLAAPLLFSALCGLALVLWGAVIQARREHDDLQRARAARVESDIESARRDALSPIDKLREDYAKMSADAPLWVFVAALPETTDPGERDFVIARALQVPNFDWDLERTVTDEHPRYRHGAIELIRYAPQTALKPEWSPMLARAIAVSAEQIAADPGWLRPVEFSNPDPVGHVRAMVEAADRLGRNTALDAALEQLRASVAGLPAAAARDEALAALTPR